MFYNYKSKDMVQDVITECLCPIVDDIEDEYSMLRRWDYLVVYAPVPVVKIILSQLIEDIDELVFHEESDFDLLDDDKNDVTVSLNNEGEVFIGAARSDKILSSPDAALLYVYDSFKKNEIEELAETAPVLIFGLEDEDAILADEPEGNFEVAKDSDGDMHGFTQSWTDGKGGYYSRSFYSTDKLTDKMLQSILEEWKI